MAEATAKTSKGDDISFYRCEQYCEDLTILEKKPEKTQFLDSAPAFRRVISYESLFFSFDMIKTAQPSSENCLFSTAALQTALSVLGAGASGKTEADIKRVLYLAHQNVPWDQSIYYFAWVRRSFQLNRKIYPSVFYFTVHILLKTNSKLDENFERQLATFRKYGIIKVVENLKGYETTINKVVARYTGGNCNEIVPPDTFNENSRGAVVAVCFVKPQWRLPFQRRFTKLKPFSVTPTCEKLVFMMKNRDLYRYNEDMNMKLVGMCLKNVRYVLYLILPNEKCSLDHLERKVYKTRTMLEKLFELIERSAQNDVKVEIPRFSFKLAMDLTDSLRSFDLASMFDPELADFSKMCSTESMHVDKVFQSVGIEISEVGLPNQEVQGPVNDRADYTWFKEPPFTIMKNFVANHPFLFMLLDRDSNAILQFGRVADPSDSGAGITMINY